MKRDPIAFNERIERCFCFFYSYFCLISSHYEFVTALNRQRGVWDQVLHHRSCDFGHLNRPSYFNDAYDKTPPFQWPNKQMRILILCLRVRFYFFFDKKKRSAVSIVSSKHYVEIILVSSLNWKIVLSTVNIWLKNVEFDDVSNFSMKKQYWWFLLIFILFSIFNGWMVATCHFNIRWHRYKTQFICGNPFKMWNSIREWAQISVFFQHTIKIVERNL